MAGLRTKPSVIAVCLGLALVTAILYWPIISHDFVTIDDQEYIQENPHVTPGLTWSGVSWAFETGYASNWHPLTWVSHMLDCTLYGLRPGGHHLTNLLLHAADTLLLFLLLNQMTGALWRSAIVAALFAWHPLHVESVAWASERKDVLSTLFWLLTTMAYVRYVRESNGGRPRSRAWYYAALACFALGLTCKPMLVTLPCVLLLLDFWPLNRRAPPPQPDGTPTQPDSLGWLVLEKLPLFALAAAASVVTYLVQATGGAVTTLEVIPPSARFANALLAYCRYLGKTLWPANLSVMYPYVKHWSTGSVLASAALLAALSAVFLMRARRSPWLIVGWLWFLGTLVPTIGLVQVGSQSMADRYMYIPGIGLFILIVWGAAGLCGSSPLRRAILCALGVICLGACLAVTRVQLRSWRNGETLFRHAVAVTRDNYIALNGLGGAVDRLGRHDEALDLYSQSVALNPHYPEGQYNLGTSLMDHGRLNDAVTHLSLAVAGNPRYAQAQNNLGKAYLKLGDLDQAVTHLSRAVALSPDYPEAHYNLGTLLLMQSKLADSVAEFSIALRLKPAYAEAHSNLGIALMQLGRPAEGAAQLAEAVQLDPANPQAHFNLGVALLQENQPADAAEQLSQAAKLDPANPGIRYHLGLALARQQQRAEAIAQYREAIRLKPEYPDALNSLACILATAPDANLRDGPDAVRLAERACVLTSHRDASKLQTLAAAYAEAGRFADATAAATKARDLAIAADHTDLAARCADMLKLFRSSQPFHEDH
jgi:Flp pilus assembly protein TadD